MNKEQILQSIRQTAATNGGTPLGIDRFESETGIKEWDWKKFWPRWNEAVLEAGCTPNKLTSAYSEIELLEKYAGLALGLGRLPLQSDLVFKARNDSSFPTEKAYRRFGGKEVLVKRLAAFCKGHSKFKALENLCATYVSPTRNNAKEPSDKPSNLEFVYLIKSGRFYKIGKSNSVGRREYELAIQLPEKASTIHIIQTDDSSGIEVYWHNRFAKKRKNGEWFELNAADVAIFKRRKFM